ncbi:MAG: hypothetical protein MJ048_04645 [Acidaminococcaceae bacterium]|nr:hypothetical protein [Acidaminococcaceae bacterium]
MLEWIVAILATAWVVANWDDVVKVAKDFVKQIASKWDLYLNDILDGAWESVLQRLEEDVAIVAQRFYFKGNDNKYYRESVCEQIDESEVPPELLAKLNKQPAVDVTQRMKEEMVLVN